MYEIEERAKQNVRNKYPHIVPMLEESNNKYETLKELLSASEINRSVMLFYYGRDNDDLSAFENWMKQNNFYIQESTIYALWDKLEIYTDIYYSNDKGHLQEYKFIFNLLTEVAEDFINKHIILKNRLDIFLDALCEDRRNTYEEDWGLFARVRQIFNKENSVIPSYMDCWYTAAYNIYNKAEDNEIKRIFKKYIVMSELE